METMNTTGGKLLVAKLEDGVDNNKRAFFGQAGGAAMLAGAIGALSLLKTTRAEASGISGWYDVKIDFGAVGNGIADDTVALTNAISAGSANQKPIFLPPGNYKITQALAVPSNTMVIGSNNGLGFGCVLSPYGCPAFDIGGSSTSFQCSIENLLIWPTGSMDHVISIDNSYSIVIRNLRIHTADNSWSPTTATIILKGDPGVGGSGHGKSNNIAWQNLVVRSDLGQPVLCILAEPGCGTHRFGFPDLEYYETLFEWRGGQIDFVQPYIERAGRYALNCNLNSSDLTAYFNTYGGLISSAASGLCCAIQSTTKNFKSFGTIWENSSTSGTSVYVYGLPPTPAIFYGVVPNVSGSGSSRFSGVSGWQRAFTFPDYILKTSQGWNTTVPANSQTTRTVSLSGVLVGAHWARANMNISLAGVQLSAYVSSANTITVVAQNNQGSAVSLNGTLFVEAGWM